MMTNTQIDEKINRINELQEEAAQIAAEIESLKDELKKECDARKEEVIDTDVHRVIYKVYSRTQVDTKKLKAAGLYDQYSLTSTYLKLTLNDKKPL